MIKAHEIQGGLALLNSFNKVGLDHVVLVKVASTAVVSKLLGLNRDQTIDAVSQAWVDGQSLRTYRHAPNTGPRKAWAAGDACSRAVNLALMVKKGEKGLPSVLTAKTWGFYDVLFKVIPSTSYFRRMSLTIFRASPLNFKFPMGRTSWKMFCSRFLSLLNSMLRPLSKPPTLSTTSSKKWVSLQKTSKASESAPKKPPSELSISKALWTTSQTASKCDPFMQCAVLYNTHSHAINYMVAYPLIFGELTSES